MSEFGQAISVVVFTAGIVGTAFGIVSIAEAACNQQPERERTTPAPKMKMVLKGEHCGPDDVFVFEDGIPVFRPPPSCKLVPEPE